MMKSRFGSISHVQQPQDCGIHPMRANILKAKNAQSSKTGSYGVSIRVQGIDGHPYIVLNNAEEGSLPENFPAHENGQLAASQKLSRSMLDSSPAPELKERIGGERPFGGTPNSQPNIFKSLKEETNGKEGENSTSHFKAGPSQPCNLLNFQRHPELLQPYDPEKNALNMDDFQRSPFSKSKSLGDKEKTDAKPWTSPLNVAPLNKSHLQLAELAKSNNKPMDSSKSLAGEDLSREELECICIVDNPSEMQKSFSSSDGFPMAVSPPSSQETRKCRPDLLPFRRQDSAGLAPNSSRCSSSSSTTPTSAASLYKFFLDDQEEAIYTDSVNRHENRRYIPFLPGTGRDIDTGSIPAVDQLIEKFDRKAGPQRRGRLGIRGRIHPDDRRRSRSVDSALPGGLKGNSECLDDFSKSWEQFSEHLVQPSKVCFQKPLSQDQKPASMGEQVTPRAIGKLHAATRSPLGSHFSSLQYHKQNNTLDESLAYKSSTLPVSNNKAEKKTVISTLLLPNQIAILPDSGAKKISVKSFASASSTQVTPDLLKGQQELARQTNEETAKQILYNYLKEGSSENDDATKRKVNLVFEKIQTLKSRATGNAQAPDTSVEVKALVEQKEGLERKVSELQRSLDLEGQKQQNVKDERDASRAELRELQCRLDESMKEKETFRKRLEESEEELKHSIEELFQVKMEREEHQSEIRDLQDQLSEMHDELDCVKHTEDAGKEILVEELLQLKQDLQAILMAKEQQEDVLRKRERELLALKGALKVEVSSHDQEMDKLKEQQEQELRVLRERLQEAVEKAEALSSMQVAAKETQRSSVAQMKAMAEESQQLKRSLAEVESQRQGLQQALESLRGEGDKTEERIKRSEADKLRLKAALARIEEDSQELASAKRSLEAQLEDAQRMASQLIQEQQQLTEQLKDEASQKDQLKRLKTELENERRQLDKTIEKLHQEMAEILEVSRMSTNELQKQLDEYKEKNRRELAETQRQLKEKCQELEKARLMAVKMQEQAYVMEEELQDHQRAQEEAMTKIQLLEQMVKALEYELEAKNHLKDDRAKQAKIMEAKMGQLELELDEERNNSDVLSERISRCREQIEQMRNELLQERATKQSVECDKISLERQNKDLKSRILHLEGAYKSSKEGLIVQMEARIMELEERLENEERDRANFQLNNRRLERKVKELMMQVDDEHLSLTDQKDQLSLRLKAMKRQVEEAEEEIDRLETAKKKLQRELEEQVDMNDQLQGQLNAVRKELRHKKLPSKLLSDLEDDFDDDFSMDGDSLYEASSGFTFLKDTDIKS